MVEKEDWNLNPFNCTKSGNLFVGYDSLRQEILTGLRNGHSYSILGGERCGKTSFLMQIEKDINHKGLHPFYPFPKRFSFHELGGALSSNHIFQAFFNLVIQSFDFIEKWQESDSGGEYQFFLKNLDKISPILTKKYGPRWLVILLIDEIDVPLSSLKNDDRFFQNFRNFLMDSHYHHHFRLIATSSSKLAHLIFSGTSPLNNLRTCYLRSLKNSDVSDLIKSVFPNRFCYNNSNDKNIELLFEITGKHPFLLQGILEKLWRIKHENWTPDVIRNCARKFLKQHSCFQAWFKNFGQAGRAVYSLLAKYPTGAMNIHDIRNNIDASLIQQTEYALTILSYHGVIDDSDPDEPRISGTLFRDWFLEKSRVFTSTNTGKENKTTMQVFISHAKEDQGTAKKLYDDLKKSGIKPWMVSEDLIHGQEAPAMIRGAIKESSYFLAILSKNSVSTQGFVHKELKIAMDILDELPQSGIFIIPVRLDDCKIYDETLDRLYPVNLHHSYETGLKQILRSTGTGKGNQSSPDSQPSKPIPDGIESNVSQPSAAVFDESKKIKILFLGANPTDNVRLRLDEEIRGIDQALRNAQFRDRFVLEQQWAVRVSDLQGHLLKYDPEIVHFSGHGSKHSEIILEDNAGNSQPIPAPALGKLFAVLKGNIRCVVLNACFSADQAKSIGEHIDYVVGMSAAIGDRAAISFASSFYQGLGFGKDIKTAFDLGCVQIALEGIDEADTPQLLIR